MSGRALACFASAVALGALLGACAGENVGRDSDPAELGADVAAGADVPDVSPGPGDLAVRVDAGPAPDGAALDALPPPDAACADAGCPAHNPAGCIHLGCPDGQVCVANDQTETCIPSDCEWCWEGNWVCSGDCGGGVCVDGA